MQGWDGSSMHDSRYGRESYEGRYGMDRYGSGPFEQPHEPSDDDADEDEVSIFICCLHHISPRLGILGHATVAALACILGV